MIGTTTTWAVIAFMSVSTILLKGTGPFLLGRRDLPKRLRPTVALLPTALMAGLVTVAIVAPGTQGGLGLDPGRLAGVAVACLALTVRLPIIVVLTGAVATTVLVRFVA